MKRFLIFFACLSTAISCGQQQKRIVSDVPIKSNIMGIELGKTTDSDTVEDLLSDATGKFFFTQEEDVGTGSVIRAFPLGMGMNLTQEILYGGAAWSYVDVSLNENSEVFSIELNASYESIERAKELFDEMCVLFSQKYGQGNRAEDQTIIWTDGENAVAVTYAESSSINGNDRSFCTLSYANMPLLNAFTEANTPDI